MLEALWESPNALTRLLLQFVVILSVRFSAALFDALGSIAGKGMEVRIP